MTVRLLLFALLLLPGSILAATGDILAVRVIADTCTAGASCNGWVAEIDIDDLAIGGTYDFGLGANNDPATAKIVFAVTSPGYDTSGTLTTIVRTVYGTQWLRKPYPDQAVKDEVKPAGTLTIRVSLSDFIYVGDTATVSIAAGLYTSGTASAATTAMAVTNNSTLAYPKPIGRWAWPAFERVTGDFLLESVIFHRSPLNGKPLAAVKYTCTDESTNSVTATVTDMTVSARVGAANTGKVLVYAATIPVTTLVQGDVVTCNFIAYPWVGDATALLNSDLVASGGDGFAQPDERLGPFAVLNDKSGTYGTAFAVVDPTNGQNSTAATWVYASQATAESNYASATTNSYTTIGNAVQAVKAYNNATHSRNEPGGGTALLTGTHVWPGTTVGATQGAQETWFTITRLSTVARASTIINSSATAGINTQRFKFYDVTLFEDTSTHAIRGTSATTDVNWIDNCTIDMSTGSNMPLGTLKLGHATRNTITALTTGFTALSTTHSPYGLVRGNAGPASSGPAGASGPQGAAYSFLGNYNLRPLRYATGNAPGHEVSDNIVIGFNIHRAGLGPWSNDLGSSLVVTHGNAYVQNTVEMQDNAQWGIDFDDNDAASNNIIVWHNTSAGARQGVGYNDAGSTAILHINYSMRGNLFEEYANKDDTHGTPNAARTGAWPVGYHVGAAGNHRLTFAGTPEFQGEFHGLFTPPGTGSPPVAGTWAFVDNAAHDAGGGGDDTGNGDYHLAAGASGINLVAAGYAVLPYDLEGAARRNDGTGAAGAYEYSTASPRRRAVIIIQ